MSDLRPIAENVSVVIPTIGRALLRGCLESIADGTVWPAELIVVDQGANADVAAWIDRLDGLGLRITHVRSKQIGIAASTNRGLERVRTPFVATTHDDCRVRTDWLGELSKRLPGLEGSILTGRVEPQGEGIVLTIMTSTEPAVYRRPMIDRDVLFPPNMAFSVTLLKRIGYLDEHPSLRFAGEDNDWAYRALRAGVPIVYDPDVVVSHLAWQTADTLPALYERYARGQGAFYGKYLRHADLFIAGRAARDVVRAPWLLLRGLLTGNRHLVAMGRGEIRGLLPGILAGATNSASRRSRRDPAR
jgi:glycosyltransferase involved in cell wall biosynthesis